MQTRWIFARQQNCDDRTDTHEDLHFNKDSDEGKYGGISSLVREAIQNSLDAKIVNSSEPVRVVFRLDSLEMNEANRGHLHDLFARLEEPLHEFNFSLKDELNGTDSIPFLVYEDFGTRGLEGRADLIKEPEKGTREDFFWFWRNSGISGKQDGSGRWGYGKSVFNSASRSRTRFGYTVRESDAKHYLMGKALLKIHEYQGEEYGAYGTWCQVEETYRDGEDCTPLPIEDENALARFRDLWKIQRKNESGLSIVMPFAYEIRAEDLIRTAVTYFFVSVLEKDLVIEIEQAGKKLVRIDAESLPKLVKSGKKSEKTAGKKDKKAEALPSDIDFIQDCLKRRSQLPEIKISSKTAPNQTLLKDAMGENQLKEWSGQFHRGEILGFRIHFDLGLSENLKHSAGKMSANFLVFVQKDSDAGSENSYFVRNGILVPNPKGTKQCRGLFLVDEKDPQNYLSRFLGDAEGPAHESWKYENLKDKKDKWASGSGRRITFVTEIVKTLDALLRSDSAEVNRTAFMEFFPDTSLKSGTSASRKKMTRDSIPETFPASASTDSWFTVTRLPGGFRINSTSVPPPPNAFLVVQAAYYVPKGNPFKKWNILDFSFYQREPGKGKAVWILNQKKLKFKGHGIHCLPTAEMKHNRLKLQILNADFEFSVTNFDIHRDLYVDVQDTTPEDGEELQ